MSHSDADIKRKIHRASLTLMLGILLSRLVGFLREWVMAQTLGASAMTDVYMASFTIPDFINYLMATGALSVSLIPMLSKYVAQGQEELAKRLFRSLTSWLGGGMILLIIAAEIFADELCVLAAPGFDSEQLKLLAHLIRIILPAQFFFFWGSLAIAVQQSHGHFLLTAAAPLLYNGGIIALGLLLYRTHGVAGFSYGVLVGAILSHGISQWLMLRRLGYSSLPYFRLPPEIRAGFRRYLWMTAPMMLGFSVVVTDEWISKYFASSMASRTVTWLSYARTEMRIPIAIIGQAAGVASFPFLSRLWADGAFERFGATFLREIQKLWAIAPLAAIVVVTHALPLTHFVYGGGRLGPEDLMQTASALKMFGLGIFFWTVQVLLARGFYACERTWLPSVIGTIISVAAIPLYRELGDRMGPRGLALSATLAMGFYSGVLALFLWFHLRAEAKAVRYGPTVRFFILWGVVLGGFWFLSQSLLQLGIYQESRLSGLADVLLATVVVSGLAWILLRTLFSKITDGPLF